MADNYRTPLNKGAGLEMLVCADLLRRGFDVYRSVSPNAECDIIARSGKKIVTVEVKSCPTYGIDKADLVAWPDTDGSVTYRGDLALLTIESTSLPPPAVATVEDSALDAWITKQQAARILRVAEKTIDRMSTKGGMTRAVRRRVGLPPQVVFNPLDIERIQASRQQADWRQ